MQAGRHYQSYKGYNVPASSKSKEKLDGFVRCATTGSVQKEYNPLADVLIENNNAKLKIIEFVCNKINFNFIPAIRTDSDAIRVIEMLIEKELSTLEASSEYAVTTATIESLQQGILDGIANQITNPLQTFLPSVRGIQIRIQKEQRRVALRRNIEVVIDDGTPTPIQLKGDGIKSLTALAMLNIPNQAEKVSVIAIEEPESHLHPEGARQLYQTILSLSEKH